MTSKKVFRPLVDGSSSHTVYGLIDGPPSSPHAHNGADDAYEDKRLTKRGWIEDTAALVQQIKANEEGLAHLTSVHDNAIGAIHSAEGSKKVQPSTEDITTAANKITVQYKKCLLLLGTRQLQFRDIMMRPELPHDVVQQAQESYFQVTTVILEVKKKLKRHIQAHGRAQGVFNDAISAKDHISVSWEVYDRNLAKKIEEHVRDHVIRTPTAERVTHSGEQQAKSIEEEEEIKKLCRKRMSILLENLTFFRELAERGELASPSSGLLQTQCSRLEACIKNAQEQCDEHLYSKQETPQRESHPRSRIEASSSRQNLVKKRRQ